MCEHDSWCQIGTGDYLGLVLCKRAKSAREKTNKDGVTFWVHRLGALNVLGRVDRHASPVAVRASAAIRHAVYSDLLASLGLAGAHVADLVERGLPLEAIERNGYASLSVKRIAVAKAVAARHADVTGVPGFVLRNAKNGGRYWTLAAAAGLLIPVRNSLGQIVALKVRRDGPVGPRYCSMSSASNGGPKAENAVHWPLGSVDGTYRDSVVVTEGELKADVVTALKPDWRCISMPGVGCVQQVVDALRGRAPTIVRSAVFIALDADWRTNPHVARARQALAQALLAEGHSVRAFSWPVAEGKGIDDYLLRQSLASRGEK